MAVAVVMPVSVAVPMVMRMVMPVMMMSAQWSRPTALSPANLPPPCREILGRAR